MNMNSTDIADQLRGVYRPDHWMRHRKWRWAYFIWAIGVAGVNAYTTKCTMSFMMNRRRKRGQAYLLSGHMPSSLSLRSSMTSYYLDK